MSATASVRRLRVAIPLLLVAILALITVSPQPAEAGYYLRGHKVHHGLEVARNQVGDPYRYGADGPNAFDCSGLTKFSYGRAGIYLPRTAASQYGYVRHIHKWNIRRGDLVFFHDGSGHIYHVGIFLGRYDGSAWVLHAPYPGKRVHRERIWTRSWYAGTLRYRR